MRFKWIWLNAKASVSKENVESIGIYLLVPELVGVAHKFLSHPAVPFEPLPPKSILTRKLMSLTIEMRKYILEHQLILD
jgi:hypothetical protein